MMCCSAYQPPQPGLRGPKGETGATGLGSFTNLFILPQGMVLSAEYIKKKLEQEMVLSQAFGRDLVRRFPGH